MNSWTNIKEARPDTEGRYFVQSNQSLIEKLQHALDEVEKPPQTKKIDLWDNSFIFEKKVMGNLTGLIEKYKDNVVMLAKFQAGLSKYIDFYSLNWTTAENQETINSLVAEIVNLALQIIQPYLKQTTHPITRCGCHDNACIKDTLGPRYTGPDLNHQSSSGTWPILPEDQAKQFLRMPESRILEENCHVYRILGPEGNPYGNWWFFDYLIDNRSFWREKFSVLTTWNSNNHYVDFSIPEGKYLKVCLGESASQQASENCILPGGNRQIWIHPDDVKNLKNHINKHKKISWPLNTLN